MKKITLKDLEWQASPNFRRGRTAKVTTIAIHWWDDPAKKPSMNGVINWFKNPANQVSAHFVVSGDRVVQMVSLNNTAWHVANHNHYTVGIEVDPRMPGNTVETVRALIDFIRTYYPGIPYKGHNQFTGNSTQCPGTVLNAVKNFRPIPTDDLYRVRKSNKQIGAYKVEKNAYIKFINDKADQITHKGKDVTNAVVKRQEAEMQKEIDKLKADLQKERNKIKDLESKLDNVIDQDNKTINELKDRLHVKAGEIEDLQDENIDLRESHDQLAKDRAKLQKQQKPLNKLGEVLMIIVNKIGRE